MKGIDIIEALQDIDETMVHRARFHKKTAPLWLKGASLAACVGCAVLLGVLAMSRLTGYGPEAVPETLAPVTSEEENLETSQQSSEEIYEQGGVEYPLRWSYSVYDSDSPDVDVWNAMEVSSDGTTMTFFDPINREKLGEWGGIIWQLEIMSRQAFEDRLAEEAALQNDFAEDFGDGWYGKLSPSGYFFAADDENVYLLHTPTDLQYDLEDEDCCISYSEYCQAGVAILDSILDLNPELTANPHWDDNVKTELFPEMYRYTYDPVTLCSVSSLCTEDEDRNINLRLAAEAINGILVAPGETFSFNDTVGQPTAEKGYREADVYGDDTGEVVMGGGVSQVASDLYLSCLLAELTIEERHSHRYLSGFVKGGQDAFVDWGKQDFQFTNQMGYTIMISCQVTESVVRVELIAVKDVDTPFEDHWSIVRPNYTEEEDAITYTIVRDVYDEENNLIRRDSTETLDEMGCGTSTYYKRGS